MPLPGSGQHLLPGLFAPVQIDREQDRGLYVEPAVWVVHPVHSRTHNEST
jgi:hypothetical protein